MPESTSLGRPSTAFSEEIFRKSNGLPILDLGGHCQLAKFFVNYSYSVAQPSLSATGTRKRHLNHEMTNFSETVIIKEV